MIDISYIEVIESRSHRMCKGGSEGAQRGSPRNFFQPSTRPPSLKFRTERLINRRIAIQDRLLYILRLLMDVQGVLAAAWGPFLATQLSAKAQGQAALPLTETTIYLHTVHI